MTRYHIALKTANVLAYALVIGVNFFHLFGNGDDDHDHDRETLIVPTDLTFQIWLLIYGLLGLFVLYQWFPPANDATVEGIKWYHVLVSVLNVTWLSIWNNKDDEDLVVLEAFVLLFLFGFLVKIYQSLALYPPKSIFDRVLLHYPFSVYTPWAGFLTVLNFWVAFPEALGENVWLSTLAVAGVGLTGLHFVDYHHKPDVIFSATIAWILTGVALNHTKELPVLVAAAVSVGLIVGGIIRTWIYQIIFWWRSRNANLDERTSLLP